MILPTSYNSQDLFFRDSPQKALSQFFIFCSSPNDRTGLTENAVPLTNDSPLDFSKPREIQTFHNLCDERGVELLALNKQIEVYWSGGIDSTAVVVSLLKAGAKDQLVIRCTKESEVEYPEFFKHLQNLGMQIKNIDFNDSGSPDSIISGGELADQIFGGGYAMTKMQDVKNIFAPYEEVVPSSIIEFISPVIKAYPRRIVTLVDLVGMLQMVYNWQWIKDRWIVRFGGLDRARLVYFFDTPKFQTWSLFTNEPKVCEHQNKADVLRSYKAIARDYIFDYNKDAVYRDLKTKFGSRCSSALSHVTSQARTMSWKYVMEDGSII